jgi:hypothetical protein
MNFVHERIIVTKSNVITDETPSGLVFITPSPFNRSLFAKTEEPLHQSTFI